MRHRISLTLTLAAWLLATGSHWDLVQTFAWGRMITTSAQSMPLLSAVKRTFTPEAMCTLCHVIATAKQQTAKDRAAPLSKSPGKILLLCESWTVRAKAPSMACASLVVPTEPRSGEQRAAPPVPPPRAVA